MRPITRMPQVGETLTYVNNEEHTQFRVTVIDVISKYALVQPISKILQKLDGSKITLKAYPGMLYE